MRRSSDTHASSVANRPPQLSCGHSAAVGAVPAVDRTAACCLLPLGASCCAAAIWRVTGPGKASEAARTFPCLRFPASCVGALKMTLLQSTSGSSMSIAAV